MKIKIRSFDDLLNVNKRNTKQNMIVPIDANPLFIKLLMKRLH